MEKRCKGQCCRVFTLPLPPEELKERYEHFLNNGKDRLHKSDQRSYYQKNEQYTSTEEIYLIYPMVKYLGKFKKTPQGYRTNEYIHHYTCKHLDKKTGNCTIYEIRPKMCRRYPDAGICYYKGCSCDRAATPKERLEFIKKQNEIADKKNEVFHKEKTISKRSKRYREIKNNESIREKDL
jgi:Fe-S-cluster containining protein